ncbi:hypothetical protein SAMN05414137_107322 [Streptacidiphilus jiangxiensis]|uniref:Uncharacterized protein n=1 Tax=Streptacidiphilus jiangxiensis TaxID=235985 RepID=A0A1H7PDE0_STRJI|nr:hypothetical protein SAMN05414137_107322 [Streptacidiphilus jiangxiensis]
MTAERERRAVGSGTGAEPTAFGGTSAFSRNRPPKPRGNTITLATPKIILSGMGSNF